MRFTFGVAAIVGLIIGGYFAWEETVRKQHPCDPALQNERFWPEISFEGRERIEQLFDDLVVAAGGDLLTQPRLVIHQGSEQGKAMTCSDGTIALPISMAAGLKRHKTETGLAGLLAHELGHLRHRHHERLLWHRNVARWLFHPYDAAYVHRAIPQWHQIEADFYALELLARVGYRRMSWFRYADARLRGMGLPFDGPVRSYLRRFYVEIGGDTGVRQRYWTPREFAAMQERVESLKISATWLKPHDATASCGFSLRCTVGAVAWKREKG